jgi:hypothetical protein
MAAQDPSSPPKFDSVVACHWVLVLVVKAVDTNAIAAMLSSRAMAVATIVEMQSYVGTTLAAAEKYEIPWSQQVARSRRHGNGLAELLLLIGVAWDPDLLTCERHLYQT